MANQDSFIDEVTDAVRRDRLFATFRKYGWIGILAVVLLVGGAAWNEWQKSKTQAAAEARGDAVLAALEDATPDARADAIGAVAQGQGGDLGAVLEMLAAGQATPEEGRDAALKRLDALASKDGLDARYRDLAVLKSIALAWDTLKPEERIARLQPLTTPGAPYRVLALEQTAYAQADAGETDKAIEILRGLTDDAEATQALRQRASRMIVALGGSLETSGS